MNLSLIEEKNFWSESRWFCLFPLRPVVAHVGDHLVLDALREAAVFICSALQFLSPHFWGRSKFLTVLFNPPRHLPLHIVNTVEVVICHESEPLLDLVGKLYPFHIPRVLTQVPHDVLKDVDRRLKLRTLVPQV